MNSFTFSKDGMSFSVYEYQENEFTIVLTYEASGEAMTMDVNDRDLDTLLGGGIRVLNDATDKDVK